MIAGVVRPVGASEQTWTIKCYHACSGFNGCSASTGICAQGLGSQPENEVTVGSREWACIRLSLWDPCPDWRGTLSKVESVGFYMCSKMLSQGLKEHLGVT